MCNPELAHNPKQQPTLLPAKCVKITKVQRIPFKCFAGRNLAKKLSAGGGGNLQILRERAVCYFF